jgi:hypothetical protein
MTRKYSFALITKPTGSLPEVIGAVRSRRHKCCSTSCEAKKVSNAAVNGMMYTQRQKQAGEVGV